MPYPYKLYTFDDETPSARIKVFGVGNAGGQILNELIQLKVRSIDFVCVSKDTKVLKHNLAETKVPLGCDQESEKLRKLMQTTDMVIVIADMGSETGIAAAPVIAEVAKSLDALTVTIISKPSSYDGALRMRLVEECIKNLSRFSDSVILSTAQHLDSEIDGIHPGINKSREDVFSQAVSASIQVIRCVTELITEIGYMSRDFADVKCVLGNSGNALMGTGTAKGEHRASKAAKRAMNSNSFSGINIKKSRGMLVTVTGNEDMSLVEFDEAVTVIHNMTDESTNIVCGDVCDLNADEYIRVTVIATVP